MEILKKIAEDRLVIMVTHNSYLANEYSSRIIKMLDGKITSDSAPPKDELEKPRPKLAGKRPSMSFATAFMLSLKNLFTKKGRTTLTAFAGSIGIMGIALILAVSQGMTNYIDAVQEDALSSYPLSIEESTIDMSTLMEAFLNVHTPDVTHDKEAVYKKTALYDMVSAFNSIESSENDLKSFKAFLEEEYNKNEDQGLATAVTGLQYSYDLGLNVYTKNVDGDILKSDTRELLQGLMAEHMGREISSMSSMSDAPPFAGMEAMRSNMQFMGGGMMTMDLWQEMLPGKDGQPINEVLKNQYDIVYGSWPKSYDEIVLVLDKNNELDDITLYALGLEPKENIDSLMSAALKGGQAQKISSKWNYEDIIKSEYRVILQSDSYIYDDNTGLYMDLRETEAGLKYLYDEALSLKVVGIIRPNEHSQSTILSGAIGYTEELTKYVIENSKDSPIIAAQRENESIDVLTGLPFKSNSAQLSGEEKSEELLNYIDSLDNEGKAAAYVKIMSLPSQEQVDSAVKEALMAHSREEIKALITAELSEKMSIGQKAIVEYIASMSDEEIDELLATSISEEFKLKYADRVKEQLSSMGAFQLAALLDSEIKNYSHAEYEIFYDEIMEFSKSSYESNLANMGYVDIDSPKVVHIFASSFKNKDIIEDAIKDYNEGKPELSQIKYTDYLAIMMSSINSIINAITYVLLAFVAISLIVSSIMIGVITLISVQERTKEIGILRAIGASKGDVSSMFNAETVIIGLASGLMGIGVTYLLCIPINIILHKVTGIGNLNAYLPIRPAAVLVVISVILSLIAGFIPSRSAAKKDPVVALRTE